MPQRVRTRTRESEPPSGIYEDILSAYKLKREQSALGAIVIRSKDVDWELARQGRLRYFSHLRLFDKLAAPGWLIFEQDIRQHSGKHLHQGGLAIFVLEGQGYTVVDGVRYDWEAGDLILLPVKPQGCEHQHFNAVQGEACHWIAFVYQPYEDVLGDELTQREPSPEWKPT